MKLMLPLAVTLAGTLAAHADDLRIAYRMGGGTGTTYTHFVSDTELRVSFASIDLIVRDGGNTIVSIDRDGHHYQEMTATDRNGHAAQAPSLATMPSDVVLTRGPNPREVLGYACDHYIITRGESSLEVWVAPQLARPSHYLGFWSAAQLSSSPGGEFMEAAVAALSTVEGMPLDIHWKGMVLGHVAATEIAAVEVAVGKLPTSTFRVPPGVTHVSRDFHASETSRPQAVAR